MDDVEPKSLGLTDEQIALLPPSMGGPRRKSPRKPVGPKVDPPEMLIPNEQITDEMWAAWNWPVDHGKLPSDKRTVALSL